MIFQAFATVVLICIAIYAYSQAKVAPLLTKFTILVAIGGEYLVLFPEETTVIAMRFGIGRGADLVFYLWVLLSLVIVLNLHLRLRGLNDRFTELTRQLALREAEMSQQGAAFGGQPNN